MNVLALDTCFAGCSVAVSTWQPGPAQVWSERQILDTGHAEALMPMVDRVMRAAGIAFAAIDRIVVTTGPGTFTGVRTCVSAARALALATGAPVIGVSSLWAIGAQFVADAPDASIEADAVLVAMDARKDQLYVQVVDRRGGVSTEPLLLDATAAVALCPDRRLVAIGTGASLVVAAARVAGRRIETVLDDGVTRVHHQPDATALLGAADRTPSVGPLLPLYLRPPDVKPQASKALPWSPS